MRSVALTLAEDLAGSGVRVGLLTVNGPTGRGSDFDPDVIAAEFWKLHEGSVTDTEIVFNGVPATASTIGASERKERTWDISDWFRIS